MTTSSVVLACKTRMHVDKQDGPDFNIVLYFLSLLVHAHIYTLSLFSDSNSSPLTVEEQSSKFRYYLDLSENYHVYSTVHQFIVRALHFRINTIYRHDDFSGHLRTPSVARQCLR